MTEPAKPAWPKLPDGSTDWETVFEDPVSGLIPVIAQAKTAPALRQCTVLVIEQLHTRKNDPEIVARFVTRLDEMVPDTIPADLLPKITDGITGILRQIKDERIAKAAAHVAKLAAEAEAKAAERLPEPANDWADDGDDGSEDDGSALEIEDTAPERRDGDDTDIPIFDMAPSKAPPYGLYAGIGAATVAAAGLAFYMIVVPSEPTSEDINKQFIQQMQAAIGGNGAKTHIYGGPLKTGSMAGRTAVTAEAVPPGACQSVAWTLAARGNVMISGVMPKRVHPKILEELCTKRLMGATLVWLPRKTQ